MSDAHASATPLRLPRFTFIITPPEGRAAAFALAEAINALDSRMATNDFESPVVAAVEDLFLGGFDLAVDLTTLPARNTPLEWLDEAVTINTVLSKTLAHFRFEYGNDILGRLALRAYEAELPILSEVYDRYLFRDCATLSEIVPFLDAFPADDCLVIYLRSMPNVEWRPEAVAKLIWLPEPDTESRIARLRKELSL